MRISDWSADVCSSDLNGGYFLTARTAEARVARTRTAADSATPAGNGTLVGVFARLWYLTGEIDWRERAQSQLDAFAGDVARNFFPMGSYLNGFDLYANAVQVAIIGRRGERSDEHTSELQSLMRISYVVFCLKKKTNLHIAQTTH